MKYIVIAVSICTAFLFVIATPRTEGFSNSKKIGVIGSKKVVHVMNVRPVVPHLALALRPHVRQWIANVPLTPFTAPLVKLPPIKDIPRFLVYNPTMLSPVRNQGDCGACWAFAVCDTLADRALIQTRGRFRGSLSVQQLLSCFAPEGCDGESPELAVEWMMQRQVRLVSEKSLGYSQYSGRPAPPCKSIPKNGLVGAEPGSMRSLVTYIDEEGYDPNILAENIANMKRELVTGGPFYCAMAVYDDLFTFSGTEIYRKRPGATLIGGHAIEVIGYADRDEDPRDGFREPHWICRNSWGKNWPLESQPDGYFMIAMGENACGIESRCGFAEPIVTPLALTYPSSPLSQIRATSFREYVE